MVPVQVVAATANAAIATEKLPAPSAAVLPPTIAPPPAPPPPPPPSFRTPPPKHVMVAEEHMSESDRRQVQSMLAGMGYYSGRIDGVFGPETRAAIRRYQFEIKAELTGRLTAEQATQLVNGIR
jgi:peptidoglycan hydrolase-like protein with peptidoglycan-binding domain